ncbi:sulfonate ABC transporter substrate-binding protein [Thiomicrorhabdus immobilis]|uniref:Sulfonate ABC transporter substrate-binding protein n=1 Tax=Thiomicrorhabdus immobilis TaxID=2791037 RepID=A0ABM7MAD2_9GAMM|nr:ABC transporter substrate-binding protein [Thiomicrorhabdus immobilis]BCN92289.1 sulfonate ABC transporter substrate-binding protein [Thiomicrorhabdus immobilis]
MKLIKFWVIFTALLLLNGCFNPEPAKIAHFSWVGYEMPFISGEVDRYPQVEYIKTQNASHTMQLLKNKQVDAGYLTLDQVLQMRDQGVDLKVVLVSDISAGADIVLAQPGIQTAADIKGKVIGYEKNALSEIILYHFLEKYRLTPADVTLHDIREEDKPKAFQDNEIDIIITYFPYANNLLKMGANELFDSSEIPETILDVLAVRESVFKEKRSAICSSVQIHLKGVDYLKKNYEDSKYQLAQRLNASAQEVEQSLNGITIPSSGANYHLLKEQSGFAELSNNLLQLMQQANMLKNQDDLTNLFSNQCIK